MPSCLAPGVSAAAVPELQPEDCAQCHSFQIKRVAADGGKHATDVGCLDCHPEHPPEGSETMTGCTLCHEGEPMRSPRPIPIMAGSTVSLVTRGCIPPPPTVTSVMACRMPRPYTACTETAWNVTAILIC
ncbi:MAG: hypothetical protein IBX47_10235 [Desulfuromonadales bacterium]|nr:hypothetical protein [Desulfuromonadales bacterium]